MYYTDVDAFVSIAEVEVVGSSPARVSFLQIDRPKRREDACFDRGSTFRPNGVVSE